MNKFIDLLLIKFTLKNSSLLRPPQDAPQAFFQTQTRTPVWGSLLRLDPYLSSLFN